DFNGQGQDKAGQSNKRNQPEVAEEQGDVELGQEQDAPEVTREEVRKSETSSTRRRLDVSCWVQCDELLLDSAQMLAVGFPVSGAGKEVSYYDREGEFWDGHNVGIDSHHSHPAHCSGKGMQPAGDPNEDRLGSNSTRRIFQRLKSIRQSAKPSKDAKDAPANISHPPLDLEAPGAPEDLGKTLPRENPVAPDVRHSTNM
ncbi:hypothetical protein PAXRUDRAFT_163243, partial [Paxillus rubicundulus Ve08.2h10]